MMASWLDSHFDREYGVAFPGTDGVYPAGDFTEHDIHNGPGHPDAVWTEDEPDYVVSDLQPAYRLGNLAALKIFFELDLSH